MPLIDYRRARQEVPLAEVLRLLNWQAHVTEGAQTRGPCPLHGSGSPQSRSFSTHLGRGVWHCFRCQASGNALDLWQQATGLPLHQAVLDLYRRLGLPIPWLAPARPVKPNGGRPMP